MYKDDPWSLYIQMLIYCELYHGENKLILNELMIIRSALY